MAVADIVADHVSVACGGMAEYCAVGVMVRRTPNRYARATSALYLTCPP